MLYLNLKSHPDREILWLFQRFTLLKTHLQELKAVYAQEKQAILDLKAQHRAAKEKQQVTRPHHVLEYHQLSSSHAKQLIDLSMGYSAQRKSLLTDQYEKEQALDRLIAHQRAAVSQ